MTTDRMERRRRRPDQRIESCQPDTFPRSDLSPYCVRNPNHTMIHVCSLARLHQTVDESGARHIVTLLKDVDLVQRPDCVLPEDHLILGMDDIAEPLDGYVAPAEEHVAELIRFACSW